LSHHLTTALFCSHSPLTLYLYTLSLHDALPISVAGARDDEALHVVGDDPHRLGDHVTGALLPADRQDGHAQPPDLALLILRRAGDRKSTRLNSSHEWISYAVFCLKKKKRNT